MHTKVSYVRHHRNSPPPKPNNDTPKEYERKCLDAHNKYRAMHGSPPLKLNCTLTDQAMGWAQSLADRDAMEHNPNNTAYGENVYLGRGLVVSSEQPVKMWYSEIEYYSFAKSTFCPQAGHFTQIVWKDTKEVGVGIAKKGESTWVVANYNPPGNVIGKFKQNVPKKLTR